MEGVDVGHKVRGAADVIHLRASGTVLGKPVNVRKRPGRRWRGLLCTRSTCRFLVPGPGPRAVRTSCRNSRDTHAALARSCHDREAAIFDSRSTGRLTKLILPAVWAADWHTRKRRRTLVSSQKLWRVEHETQAMCNDARISSCDRRKGAGCSLRRKAGDATYPGRNGNRLYPWVFGSWGKTTPNPKTQTLNPKP